MESEPSPNLKKWLHSFSCGRDAEASFNKMGAHLSPLIFQTAYRTSGNRELAKDLTQAVLLIISQKAVSLAKHPAIPGWVHETTRRETLKAMRSLARRKKREETAMKHLERTPEPNRELLEILDESMRSLSTSEKELVLMKYFEDRSYKSITAETGRSESAEKMRLKRALEKMSHWLGRKGVVLSVTGLGSLLSAEMAKGAPVIACNFAITTPNLHTGNIITQTLATISPVKLALGTGLLVLAGATVPVSSTWKELQKVKATKVLIDQSTSAKISTRTRMDDGQTKTETVSDIVDGLTDIPKDRYGTEELGLKLTDAIEYRDQALLHEINQILAQFNSDELRELAKTIVAQQRENPPSNSIKHLMELLPKGWSPSKRIDWAIAVHSHERVPANIFSTWLDNNRTAAREWLVHQTETGALKMTGVNNDPEGCLWKELMKPLYASKEKCLRAKTFLSLPEVKRQRLSNYRVQIIPRSVIHQEQGLDTALTIIRKTNDSSERHWINALVNSGHAPKKRHDFERWLEQCSFNEIEHKWAMSFFKEEEQK